MRNSTYVERHAENAPARSGDQGHDDGGQEATACYRYLGGAGRAHERAQYQAAHTVPQCVFL